MKKLTTRFFIPMTFSALLVFFGEPSQAASISQSYVGSVSRIFNDPTENQISSGDSVTGTLTYTPSSTETNGLLTDWSFISENFTLHSNSSEFSYFEQDSEFWIFDLTGNIDGTIGSSDFNGSVWIMLDGDFSDFPTFAPPTLEDLVGRLGSGQLTFFVEEPSISLFEIEIRSEDITTVVPLPTSLMLFLSGIVGLTLSVWGKRV